MDAPERKPIWQLRRLTLDHFHGTIVPVSAKTPSQIPATLEHGNSQAFQARKDLEDARNSFASTIPREGNHICHNADRSAVLRIYQQALENLKASNHAQVQLEASLKIKTVLGLRAAEPDDVVFAGKGMMLPPLEPQYAEPRIDFADDRYGYMAAKRLNRWRRDGWPDVFPQEAVLAERMLSEEEIEEEKGNWEDEVWDDEGNGAVVNRSE